MERAAIDQHWVQALDLVVGALDELPLHDVQARCALARSRFEAAEVRRLAAEVRADGDDSRARRLASAGGHRSKRAARAAAARAKAVSTNPGLADDLDTGDLSGEKLDTIAQAMATDEGAATDQPFIDAIKRRSVDQGRKLARDRKAQSHAGEAHACRQRRLRNARRYDDRAAGLSAISLAGDDATVDELWRLVRQRERQIRENDGGRDVPPSQHPSTHDQRLFDALADLIRGVGSPVGRPSTVLVVPVGGPVRTVSGAPVSNDVAAQILRRSSVSVLLTDKLTGQPLWLGRSARRASSAQFLALVVRDRGCVLCQADWVGCQAHHLTPWHSPARGNTDVDQLALMCTDCHHQLHSQHRTLVPLADGTWKTRPASPDEIAPLGHHRRTGASTASCGVADHRRSRHRDDRSDRAHQPPKANDHAASNTDPGGPICAAKATTRQAGSNKDPSNKDPSDKDPSNKDPSVKDPSDKDPSNKDPSDYSRYRQRPQQPQPVPTKTPAAKPALTSTQAVQ